jgi:chemotaxis protein CheZ
VAAIPFPVERRANARHLRALAEGLARLSAHVTATLNALPIDPRLAQGELPAPARLGHVVRTTDEAARRTLDLVEKSRALMERLRLANSDLGAMRAGMIRPTDHALGRVQGETDWCVDQLRQHLAEMAVTQVYQDLAGRIVGRVVHLATETEHALAELLANAGLAAGDAPGGDAPPAAAEHSSR